MAPVFSSVDTAIMGRKTLDVARGMGGSFGDSRMAYYVFSTLSRQASVTGSYLWMNPRLFSCAGCVDDRAKTFG